MSFGERHWVSFVAAMKVASLGALQFNLGVTMPPNSLMVFLIWVWISCHSVDGSGSSSPESENVSRLSSSAGATASGGRTMPSARRYLIKGAVNGMTRDLGASVR